MRFIVCVVALASLLGCSPRTKDPGDEPSPRDAAAPDAQGDDDSGSEGPNEDASTDPNMPDEPAAPVWVSNSPSCRKSPRPYLWIPGAAPDGVLVTARLTPPDAPFEWTTLRYELGLNLDYGCDTRAAHRVHVFKASSEKPPARPEVLAKIDVPAVQKFTEKRLVTLALPDQVTVEPGEHLFVGVEFRGSGGASAACLSLCPCETCDGATDPQMCADEDRGNVNRNFQSKSAKAPFDWHEFCADGDVPDNLYVEGRGRFVGE